MSLFTNERTQGNPLRMSVFVRVTILPYFEAKADLLMKGVFIFLYGSMDKI